MSAPTFFADSRSVFATHPNQGATMVTRFDLDGTSHVVVRNIGGDTEFSTAVNGTIAFPSGSFDHPADIMIVSPGGRERALTALNEALLRDRQLATIRPLAFRSALDGAEVGAWLVCPPNRACRVAVRAAEAEKVEPPNVEPGGAERIAPGRRAEPCARRRRAAHWYACGVGPRDGLTENAVPPDVACRRRLIVPPLTGLLETALYVNDKPKVVAFFKDVMGLTVLREDERLTALDAGNSGVLLIFIRGASRADAVSEAGTIPGHDGTGPLHMAFAIPTGSYDAWRDHLRDGGVPERGEMRWPAGGRSFYFEDPEGHVLEVATPGVWPNY